MWICNSRIFLLLLIKLVWVQSKETIIIKTSDESKENTFIDVLKNITSANRILQELIKSYEKLQKIYKSAEKINDESEFENNFKALASQEAKTTRGYGITQMIYMGESQENSEEVLDNKENGSNVVVIESSEVKEINPAQNNSINASSSEYSDEIKVIPDNRNKTDKKAEETNLKPTQSDTQNKSMTHFNLSRNKTRFSIKNRDGKRNFQLQQSPNDKTIKRIMYAEVFSPDKIWEEIVHKPVKLEVFDDHANLKIAEAKTRTAKNKVRTSRELIPETSSGDTEKEETKSAILREAYGDACLQVAVRKCYKALKAVRKNVCRLRFKCKSALKGSFIENAKRGCIREFGNGKDKKINKETQDFVFERMPKANDDTEVVKFVDLCLPHLTSTIINKKPGVKNLKDYKNLNVLRDRFEKACKKLSAKKCRKACQYATDNSCSTHTCENGLKKGFRKSCKSECKTAYNLYSNDNSDDDDDDYGSESESD